MPVTLPGRLTPPPPLHYFLFPSTVGGGSDLLKFDLILSLSLRKEGRKGGSEGGDLEERASAERRLQKRVYSSTFCSPFDRLWL